MKTALPTCPLRYGPFISTDLHGKNHVLSTDNWYTSVATIEEVMNEPKFGNSEDEQEVLAQGWHFPHHG